MSTTYPSTFLSYALERAYSFATLNESHPASFNKAARKLGRALWRGTVATGHFVADAINAQAEARADSTRYTRAPW